MIPAPLDADDELRLVHRTRTVAAAVVASSRAARRRGLRGVDWVEGVLVLRARSVHTFGMRCPIDVAHCTSDGTVTRVVTMPPGRIGRPVWGAPIAVEAAAGSFGRWGVAVGDRLELVA